MAYPSKKTPQIVRRFLEAIRNGRSAAQACKAEGMPSTQTILNWVESDPDFAAQYEKAKEERGNYYGELVAEISLAGLQGKYKDSGMLRAAIDGLKWSAARMAPKGFGDRMQVEHSAESSYVDALKAVQTKVEVIEGDAIEAQPLSVRARGGSKRQKQGKEPTIQ